MAQDIKTAFFDIDGTLTSFVTHVVPQSTVDALHALQRNGVKGVHLFGPRTLLHGRGAIPFRHVRRHRGT